MNFKLKTSPKRFRIWIDSTEKPGWQYFDFEKLLSFCPNYDENGKPRTVYQSIGLRDKSGKEIFEGDILKFDNNPDPKLIKILGKFWEYDHAIVGFDEGSFIDSGIKRSNDDCFVSEKEEFLNVYDIKKWFIIGNVVENPELLEQKLLYCESED